MRPSLLVSLLAAPWLLASAPALACSCAYGVVDVLPWEGESVPTNAALVVFGIETAGDDPQILSTSTGESIPYTTQELRAASEITRFINPTNGLPADDVVRLDMGEWGQVEFTTRGGTDELPPEGGNTIVEASGAYSGGQIMPGIGCGTSAAISLTVSSASDESPVLYEVEVADDRDFQEMRGTVFSPDTYIRVGSGSCVTNLADIDRADSLWFRVRPTDLAGNVGEWGEPVKAMVPMCAVADSGASAASLLLLSLALRLRLRRRAGAGRPGLVE